MTFSKVYRLVSGNGRQTKCVLARMMTADVSLEAGGVHENGKRLNAVYFLE